MIAEGAPKIRPRRVFELSMRRSGGPFESSRHGRNRFKREQQLPNIEILELVEAFQRYVTHFVRCVKTLQPKTVGRKMKKDERLQFSSSHSGLSKADRNQISEAKVPCMCLRQSKVPCASCLIRLATQNFSALAHSHRILRLHGQQPYKDWLWHGSRVLSRDWLKSWCGNV